MKSSLSSSYVHVAIIIRLLKVRHRRKVFIYCRSIKVAFSYLSPVRRIQLLQYFATHSYILHIPTTCEYILYILSESIIVILPLLLRIYPKVI